jgi:diguanylate cyclase (GGDEF)-like protein/putative nucleotidyltransferase with HDIG domain
MDTQRYIHGHEPIHVLWIVGHHGTPAREGNSPADLLVGDDFFVEKCTNYETALSTVEHKGEDVVLLDTDEPLHTGMDILTQINSQQNDVPVIVISSKDDTTVAVQTIRNGAQEYLCRDAVSAARLRHAIYTAIERQHILTELHFALASEKVLMEELDKKNKELVKLSVTDGLTGLYNHRFIQERLSFEFNRAQRYDSSLSCLLIDIDHFKSVNDIYGHQFGDLVLSEIADIVKANSREVDICGRYGGEEFMCIANVNAGGAMEYASKLHDRIENHVFSNGEVSINVTVSIGVAEYVPNETTTKKVLIERADEALYWAKEGGRNMIRQWKKDYAEHDQTNLDNYGIEGLKNEFIKLSSKMRETYIESTNALVRAIDAKDKYTQAHSKNVAKYAVALARAVGLDEKDISVIRNAGLLHDVGKIGIPQEILVKEGRLSDKEYNAIKQHPVIGANILQNVEFLKKEVPLILHHHERWDGAGYPYQLKGKEIPLGAQILSVADAYDAMTTDRSYRKKMNIDEAINEIRKGKEKQFNPWLVDTFITNVCEKEKKDLSIAQP